MQDGYNGWTNYATWRVNLEIFDGRDWADEIEDSDAETLEDFTAELRQRLQDDAESVLDETSADGLVKDYALAFLSDVNWGEIAQHIAEDYRDQWEEAHPVEETMTWEQLHQAYILAEVKSTRSN
jgi:hypothetical protein